MGMSWHHSLYCACLKCFIIKVQGIKRYTNYSTLIKPPLFVALLLPPSHHLFFKHTKTSSSKIPPQVLHFLKYSKAQQLQTPNQHSTLLLTSPAARSLSNLNWGPILLSPPVLLAGEHKARWVDFSWQPSRLSCHPSNSCAPFTKKTGVLRQCPSYQHSHKTPYDNHCQTTAALWREVQTHFNTHSLLVPVLHPLSKHSPCTSVPGIIPGTIHDTRRHTSKSNRLPNQHEAYVQVEDLASTPCCSPASRGALFPSCSTYSLHLASPASFLSPDSFSVSFSSQDPSPTPCSLKGPRQREQQLNNDSMCTLSSFKPLFSPVTYVSLSFPL